MDVQIGRSYYLGFPHKCHVGHRGGRSMEWALGPLFSWAWTFFLLQIRYIVEEFSMFHVQPCLSITAYIICITLLVITSASTYNSLLSPPLFHPFPLFWEILDQPLSYTSLDSLLSKVEKERLLAIFWLRWSTRINPPPIFSFQTWQYVLDFCFCSVIFCTNLNSTLRTTGLRYPCMCKHAAIVLKQRIRTDAS